MTCVRREREGGYKLTLRKAEPYNTPLQAPQRAYFPDLEVAYSNFETSRLILSALAPVQCPLFTSASHHAQCRHHSHATPVRPLATSNNEGGTSLKPYSPRQPAPPPRSRRTSSTLTRRCGRRTSSHSHAAADTLAHARLHRTLGYTRTGLAEDGAMECLPSASGALLAGFSSSTPLVSPLTAALADDAEAAAPPSEAPPVGAISMSARS